MRKASSSWPRRGLVLFVLFVIGWLFIHDTTAPLAYGADRAMIFSRHIFLYGFLAAAMFSAALGAPVQVLVTFVVIAVLMILGRSALSLMSLEPSGGLSIAEQVVITIRRRITEEVAVSLTVAGFAGLLCWRTYVTEKAAEPGATDNPDDAQRLREDH